MNRTRTARTIARNPENRIVPPCWTGGALSLGVSLGSEASTMITAFLLPISLLKTNRIAEQLGRSLQRIAYNWGKDFHLDQILNHSVEGRRNRDKGHGTDAGAPPSARLCFCA